MNDMFFTDKKLERRINEIANYRYRDIRPISEFLMKKDEEYVSAPALPTEFDENVKFCKGDFWAAWDGYLWLRTEITIPEEWKGKRALGFFDFGRSQRDGYSYFETMCYLNEIPYMGVDQFHREVFFKEEAYGTKQTITIRLWSGLNGFGGVPEAGRSTALRMRSLHGWMRRRMISIILEI